MLPTSSRAAAFAAITIASSSTASTTTVADDPTSASCPLVTIALFHCDPSDCVTGYTIATGSIAVIDATTIALACLFPCCSIASARATRPFLYSCGDHYPLHRRHH